MIDAILVDDEKSALITLRNDLRAYCPMVNIRAEFTKAADALDHMKEKAPDVIFLDIDMPVMNGFDFVRALKQPVLSQIIFVTAYSEFAIRAFKVSALDYLLKPIVPADLQAAVDKVVKKDQSVVHHGALPGNFMENASMEAAPSGKIALPVNDGYHLIDPIHIIYCRAVGAYTEIVLDNEKSFLISRNLGRTRELMPADHFERVHQSYLINMRQIKKFRKGESPVAVMANDDIVKVSRVNKDRIAQLLGIK
ncbi:MAG TPA: LytTR family DNA-binding domain-containing protein [Puia sp.]|nr:LytTR family DNA-binding domain-containing protein [Puia sp.]